MLVVLKTFVVPCSRIKQEVGVNCSLPRRGLGELLPFKVYS